MATSKYLDSVLKVMPAIQARQIADLLNKLRVSGEVRNAEEYSDKLTELSTLINDQNPIPSFKQIASGMWYLCESTTHNIMMDALKNDLEALFMQIDEIGNKVNDHHFLVMKNLAADLERGLADQENKIRRLEWLSGQENEFSLALVNSFVSASLLKVSRSDQLNSGLYFDNRTYANKTEIELPSAIVDEMGEKLILDVSNNPIIYPVFVRRLNDQYSYGTEEVVDTDQDLSNIIDGIRGTYWTRNVYLSTRVPRVTTILDFDLGTAKDINYISIEGASAEPFIIKNLVGVHPDGSMSDLISFEVKVSGKTRIDFDRVFVRSFQITFSVCSYYKAEYYVPNNVNLHEFIEPHTAYKKTARTTLTSPAKNVAAIGDVPKRLQISNLTSEIETVKTASTKVGISKIIPSNRKTQMVTLANDIAPTVREVINSDKLSDLLNIPKAPKKKQINSYVYTIGLDNVWAGNSKYTDSGVFVSKQLTGENLGVIAVNTSENLGSGEITNSVEYQIIKRDKHPFFKEVNFPIPSLGQTHVESERLVLTKKEDRSDIEDAGQLRMCPYIPPDWAVQDGTPITVYENGKELLFGSDYEYALQTIISASGQSILDWEGSDWITASYLGNYKLSIPKVWIKILRPSSSAVYTVDYEIRTSDTYASDKTLWLDTDKTIFLSHKGRVNFRRDNLDAKIISDIYLQITLRRNIASQSKSPELLEYAVLGATYN